MFLPFYPENIMKHKLPGLQLLVVTDTSLGEEPKVIHTVGRVQRRGNIFLWGNFIGST